MFKKKIKGIFLFLLAVLVLLNLKVMEEQIGQGVPALVYTFLP